MSEDALCLVFVSSSESVLIHLFLHIALTDVLWFCVFLVQFIVDRIIQDFRARSQLLVSQHEEEDEVVCTLSDTSESEDEADQEPSRYKQHSELRSC